MPNKVWDGIIYPFLNFNGATWNLLVDKLFQSSLYNGRNYLSTLGLRLNRLSKMGPQQDKESTMHVADEGGKFKIKGERGIIPH